MGRLPVNSQVNEIVVDPRNPKNVFAAGPAGVLLSIDSGLSWLRSGQGLDNQGITALAIDPTQPDTMFAASDTGALFRSDDGAQSWQVVKTNSQ